jgi:hypothetical protein
MTGGGTTMGLTADRSSGCGGGGENPPGAESPNARGGAPSETGGGGCITGGALSTGGGAPNITGGAPAAVGGAPPAVDGGGAVIIIGGDAAPGPPIDIWRGKACVVVVKGGRGGSLQ